MAVGGMDAPGCKFVVRSKLPAIIATAIRLCN